MIFLALQYEKWSGPDAIGQHKIIFSMDESINAGEFNPLLLKKGTQFLVMLVPADSKEEVDFAQETPAQTKERFSRHFHALITDISEQEGVSQEDLKDSIKQSLIDDGEIVSSTKELTVGQLAGQIIKLKKRKYEFKENKS